MGAALREGGMELCHHSADEGHSKTYKGNVLQNTQALPIGDCLQRGQDKILSEGGQCVGLNHHG